MVSINTNLAALTAQRNLQSNAASSQSSIAKLSSGSRVPTAKDDAAALAIGSRLNSEVVALQQASLNAGQASSLLQIADGAMGQISDILTRMQSLAVQSNSGQLSSTERTILNSEFVSLRSEVDRIAADTKFNGVSLLNGSNVVTANVNGATTSEVGSAQGFSNYTFDGDFGDGAIRVTYDATGNAAGDRALIVENLETGATQIQTLGATAIGAGLTEEVTFDQIGVTIELNSAFNKGADRLGAADTFALGAGAGAISNVSIVSVTSVDGANAFDFGTINDAADVTIETGGTAASTELTLDINGTSFTAATGSGNPDTTSLGTAQVTLEDGDGNQVTIEYTVTTALNDAAVADAGTEFGLNSFGNVVGASSTTSTGSSFSFQVGTGTTSSEDQLSVTVTSVNTTQLGINSSTITDTTTATSSITALEAAATTLNTARANIGASQSRLDFAASNLAVAIENNTAARSALLDADVAAEITEFTSTQVLIQAGVSILAQANQQPGVLVQLLQ